MISYLLRALCLHLLFPALVSATTIAAVRTPTDIYIGADSRVTVFRADGAFSYGQQCKIRQVGNIIFTAAGPYGREPGLLYPNSGLDIESSLMAARIPGETIQQTITRFENIYAEAMAKSLQVMRTWPSMVYQKAINVPIHVFFFGFEEIPVSYHRRFTHQKSDPHTINITRWDCPPGCTDPHMAGAGYADAIKKFASSVLQTQSPIDLIRDTVESSIKDDPEQQSGPPIDILHIDKDGAKWIQKKEECPTIQPQKKL